MTKTMKPNRPDVVVDVTDLFGGIGPVPGESSDSHPGPGHRSEDQRHIFFPDPLGILDKLTDGLVHDPLRRAITKVIPRCPTHEDK